MLPLGGLFFLSRYGLLPTYENSNSSFSAVSAILLLEITGGFAVMAGNYERSMHNQLMEVMVRLGAVEKDLRDEKSSKV